MKKIVLIMIAMLSMTMANAENENANTMQATQAYDMHVNMRKLAVTLGLTKDQMEAVQDIHESFCQAMMLAAQATGEDREVLTDQAVRTDARYMRYVLDHKQYRTYLMLLNATLHNRGIR